ncbi:Fibronectin type III domain-containing protein 7 [Merluccius polli]|uniref:Fibronectin type III domain-containing protein 7 n=1 Tax=Merluccius polli TaxID=89951 RepID=A0AA47P7G0_MERPO|nr:Fibronectin type III domain-containing protein 7 [Merluccius polli]
MPDRFSAVPNGAFHCLILWCSEADPAHLHNRGMGTTVPVDQICTADDYVVVFTVTSRSVTMRWAAYSGASYYKVSATPQNVPGSVPAFFLFNGDTVLGGLNTLLPNTAYTMRVDAMDDNLNVLSSIGTAEALTAPEIPDIELVYSKQSTSITVEFTEVDGALGYILRAMSDVGDFFEETQVHGSPGTVQGLLPFTNYTLSVMSVNLGGRSQPSYSVELSTVVVAPELETRSDTNSTITVTWDPVEHAVQYTLYIIREGSNTILKINTTGTEETFDQLEAGTWYSIKGTAWDEYGRLGDHNTTRQITRPWKPDPIYMVPAAGRSVGISVYWAVVYGADSYTATSSSGQNCSSEGDSYCIISPLDCGQNLSIVVISKNLAGPSVPSDEEDFVTIPCPPEHVWVEEPTPGSCQVAWSEVPMADFYMTFIKIDDGAEYLCNTTSRLCPFDCICGYTYLTTVFAYNPSGASPQGLIVNYTTGNVSVELVSTETLEIMWSPVRGADLYETTAVQPNAVIHCNDTSPLCALSDLRCNTNYSVVVMPCSEQQGCNRTCPQQWHETAPCTPLILHINQTNDSIVRVYYTTPNAPGTSYHVTVVGNTGTHVCVSESDFCEFALLSCGTVYKVVAVASNGVGRSLPSFSVPLETGEQEARLDVKDRGEEY